MDNVTTMNPFRAHLETLEQAGRIVEKHMINDSAFPRLAQMMHLSPQCLETCSGLNDYHYPSMEVLAPGVPNVKQVTTVSKVPLPPEVMEHFGHMQCHCMMGLFPEIHRAWLTIDSDIYIWSYEHGTDLAYFDGLGEVIVSVGLVKPKPNVFYQYIKYLLVLTTTVEIVVLGVKFTSTKPDGPLGALEEMHLLPEPIFVVPTDGIGIITISSSDNGRLFLGGRDGSLFEIEYKAERNWFGKRFSKKNHSSRYLSYLVPSFISSIAYGEDNPIVQISVDNSRNILYTLSEKGSIEVWDLGDSGLEMSKVTTASQSHIVQAAVNIVKTLDAKCFRPIIHISALEIYDSKQLNLVAVSQTGVRFYFATSSLTQPPCRPNTLVLHHVRMPPGFSANPPSYRPTNATMALYSRGSLVLITSPGGEQDTLWCLSNDPYPYQSYLIEAQTIIPLDGKVWAISEVKSTTPFLGQGRGECTNDEDPPLVVRQHMEPPRKFVLLTAQGAQVITKLRPVDLLRQFLIESRGPDSEAIKSYFQVQKEEQACATCLILACLESQQNLQISEWATRAFFLYGSEPQIGRQMTFNANTPTTPGTPYQYGFNPGMASTPRSLSPGSPVQEASTIVFSAKHNGLYIYVSRILRPLWSERIVTRITTSTKQQFLCSKVTSDECVWVLGYLHSVKAFLEKNSQFTTNASVGLLPTAAKRDAFRSPLTPLRPATQKNVQLEAQLEEKTSLLALKSFVSHACEVLGLWKILCEHQFHVIADMLDKELQNHLPEVTFRELLLSGYQLCSLLINSLINSYLGDNASVDSISSKLREVCPNLYKNEDAACSKANEMLLAAKKCVHVDEKDAKLKAALDLCKEVVPQIDLAQICQQFAANQFYIGVLQICLTCAKKQDPKNIALHWYKNREPPEDLEGYDAYVTRMNTYKQLTLVLDQLYNMSLSAPSISTSPNSSYCQESSSFRPTEVKSEAKRLLQMILESDDELLHIAVYEWMLSKELQGDLISITNPSLENYLTRTVERNPNQIQISDLLWKYYEKNLNHAAAAKILHRLAVRKGQGLTLSQRIGYLARAVMCMRSDKVGSAPHLGVFLQELEDKREVAFIQQMVYDAVSDLHTHSPEIIEDAKTRLNNELFTCTELYEEFAEPFKLWECNLALVHSTSHNDPQLIEDIWRNIIETELSKHGGGTIDKKLSGLLTKMKDLTEEYVQSPRCFPLQFIVRTLEVIRCKHGAKENQAFPVLISAGVSYSKLLHVYSMISNSNDRTWALEGNEFHIIETIAAMCAYFADTPHIVLAPERRAAVTKSRDVISNCLLSLYAKTQTQELINVLKGIESRLKRMEGLSL
ncbi:hypothetical protein RUM43_007682 [Polyplax serrata]|uniref:Nuclear pore complex protein Nup155 n=1 Tax=Polyplax serrata TaxID=468196 RepID=A0AAN8S8S4_POLSC